MQVRRVITAYMITLAVCLIIVAGRTAPGATWTSQEPPPPTTPDVALSSPAPGAPTIGATRGAGRPVRVDLRGEDIPFTALTAYRRAAAILAQVDPDCGLRWTLIAALGRVESNHGQTVGATLDSDGMSRPVVDPATHGLGPMRFFPTVWEVVAVDGDGDGRRVAEDIDDAALAAAVYLCAETADLRTRSGMAAAVRGYNDSERYVDLVLGYEKLYREGDFLVVASSGEAAPASIVLAGPRLEATPFNRPVPSVTARARIKAEARETMARAARPGATAGPASPSPRPAAESSDGTRGSQTAAAQQPSSRPKEDQGDPEAEQPTDATTGGAASEEPSGTTGGAASEQPTASGPDTPDQSPADPGSPENPDPPKDSSTSPDACTTTDAPAADAGADDTDSAEGDQADREGTDDGTGGDAGDGDGSTGHDEAADACPDPAPEPCKAPDEDGTADAGADQGEDASADPGSMPDQNTCEPSPEP